MEQIFGHEHFGTWVRDMSSDTDTTSRHEFGIDPDRKNELGQKSRVESIQTSDMQSISYNLYDINSII